MEEANVGIKARALNLLRNEANKIEYLLIVQKEKMEVPTRPMYEEILNTHIFGLSKTIDFVIRLKLVSESEGKEILLELERKLYKHINVS
ncbi:DUF1507 family protein [Alkalihalobacillus sp. BA299]|uniref:DUF1507 family protein n=1 Tax=Alkalihalobacillus sp. BA299 TaxID=2815938 RepID=UPI001ADA184D|nr:DUF1507 family protein [Alkalihalobacillus sp. BA299]